jgi:hypothetical protein
MTEFTEGQRVTIDGREVTFLRLADPDEAVQVEIDGLKTRRDAAWVESGDGTTERVPYYQLRPAE